MSSGSLYVYAHLAFAGICLVSGAAGIIVDVKPVKSGLGKHMPLRDRKLLYRIGGFFLFITGLAIIYLELPFILA